MNRLLCLHRVDILTDVLHQLSIIIEFSQFWKKKIVIELILSTRCGTPYRRRLVWTLSAISKSESMFILHVYADVRNCFSVDVCFFYISSVLFNFWLFVHQKMLGNMFLLHFLFLLFSSTRKGSGNLGEKKQAFLKKRLFYNGFPLFLVEKCSFLWFGLVF